MISLWQKLKKPIMAQAPMADVTDAVYRQIIAKYGHPDVMYTEFVSADGLCSDVGRPKLMRELYFTPSEHPIIGQIFGSQPENIYKAAKLLASLGFNGIDINMGCPDRGVEKQGAGAALIKNPELAKEIIMVAQEGGGGLPVSVKTRIGYKEIQIERWTAHLLEVKPAAITFHLRTREEMSKATAHWDLIHIPVEMARGSDTLILGNGDVQSLDDGHRKVERYGVDGIMYGRGIFGNPWFFSGQIPSRSERLRVMVEHARLFEDLFCKTEINERLFGGHTKSFAVMKKHFKAYAADFEGAAPLRTKLMETENADEVQKIVTSWYSRN